MDLRLLESEIIRNFLVLFNTCRNPASNFTEVNSVPEKMSEKHKKRFLVNKLTRNPAIWSQIRNNLQ